VNRANDECKAQGLSHFTATSDEMRPAIPMRRHDLRTELRCSLPISDDPAVHESRGFNLFLRLLAKLLRREAIAGPTPAQPIPRSVWRILSRSAWHARVQVGIVVGVDLLPTSGGE
jgi:hypothetical protein